MSDLNRRFTGYVREWPDGIYKSTFRTPAYFFLQIVIDGQTRYGWAYSKGVAGRVDKSLTRTYDYYIKLEPHQKF